MMAELFNAVLTMSITATVAVLVLLLLRLVLKKLNISKRVVFLLWAVVLFRMVCPTSFENPLSLMGALPFSVEQAASGYVGTTITQFDTGSGEGHDAYLAGVAGGGEVVTPPDGGSYVVTGADGVSPPSTVGSVWLPRLAILWMAGMFALCALSLLSYLRLKSKVRAAIKSEDGAWETDQIDSPFVLGFFPAKIYLPLGLSGETRRYVLLHEHAHIRRGDHIVKAVAFTALTLHWFNPLLWLAWALACRDMEAACDESVLRGSAEDIRQPYSSALLSLAGVRPVRAPLAFGENDVKGRIKGVLRYKQPAAAVTVCAILLSAALTFALAADPARLTLEQIVYQRRNATVVSQTPRGLEFTIRKSDLPENIDFTLISSETNYDIPVYEDGVTTIFLKSISYANGETDYLSAYFDCRYTLPDAGTVLIPYTMDYDTHDGKPSFVFGGGISPTGTILDGETVFEDAVSIHGLGPSEQFSVYIPTEVFSAAKDTLTFTMTSFNSVAYDTK